MIVLYLNISKVDSVEVCQHLADLLLVLQDCPGRLRQVVEAGVAPQRLGEGPHRGQLDAHHLRGAVLHGLGQPGLQALGKVPDCLSQ